MVMIWIIGFRFNDSGCFLKELMDDLSMMVDDGIVVVILGDGINGLVRMTVVVVSSSNNGKLIVVGDFWVKNDKG